MSKYGPFPQSGYVNEKGEIMIPMDTYRCMSDTFEYYGLIEDIRGDGKFYGIDKNRNKLFQGVPGGEGDAIEEQEGRIMIQKEGKYGFANHKGEVVIEPEYDCVRSRGFLDGVALVSKKCIITNDEKSWFKSDKWIVIDKCGNKIDTISTPD